MNAMKCSSRFLTAAIVTLLLACTAARVASAEPHRYPAMLAMDRSSVPRGSKVAYGTGPARLNINEPFVRFTKTDGHVDFTIACDPNEQNYLTVKIWGGSGSGGWPGSVLVVRDPATGASPFGQVPSGSNFGKHPLKGEIVRQHEQNPFPGRFYYATYPIPLKMTRGTSAVQLRLMNKGRSQGVDVYRVYAHRDPFFTPAEDEVQGPPFELGPPRKAPKSTSRQLYEQWKAEANRGIEKAGDAQIFGDKWQKRFDNGEVPAWTFGALNRRGAPHARYQKLEGEKAAWGGWLMKETHGNMGGLRHFLSFANAYHGPWSNYHQDPEMLERIVAGMDFYCKAQGSHGGFLGPRLPDKDVNWPTWVGGPNRKPGHHRLEAGQKYLYTAFLRVVEDLKKRGMLDKRIDHDLDPATPDISRKDAYVAMLKNSYDYAAENVTKRHIANQIIHNYVILQPINDSIKAIRPEAAAPQKQMNELAEIAGGIRRHPEGGHYAYSPRGMPQEDGYDGNYGKGGMQLVELAELADHPKIKDKVRRTFESYAHFMFLSNDHEGHRVLRNTEWISNRVMKGFPGRIRYFLSDYAARELKIPAAIRYFELYREHGRHALELGKGLNDISGHTSVAVLGATEKARLAHERHTAELPPTDYRLPDERDEDCAFVDEHLGLVALRHKGARLFAMLNWDSRNGRNWTTGKLNGLARIRYTTPTIDRLVTAHCVENKDGPLGLSAMRYGPYLVVVNASETDGFTYKVPANLQGRKVTDLLSRQPSTLGKQVSLPPFSSHVFVVDGQPR